MKSIKLVEEKYQIGEITEDGVELAEEFGNTIFDTKLNAEEFIKNELNEKYYVVYKTKIIRQVAKIIKQVPSPCKGRTGHHTLGHNEPFFYCNGCGYKLRRTNGWTPKYVLVKPLQQKPDSEKLLSIVKQFNMKISALWEDEN